MRRISHASRGLLALSLLAVAAVAACTAGQPQPAASPASGDGLQVVATTTIAGDVVRQVGGDLIDVHVLLPVGADPHGFQPTPRDMTRVTEADMIVVNGLGLEEFLERILQSTGGAARTVDLSTGITPRELDQDHGEAGEQAGRESETDHTHEGEDPHVWTDPNNVRRWVATLAAALAEMDPAQAQAYQANAARYDRELQALDAWIAGQVAQIPEANREMVVDHEVFGYFADRYGLATIGTVIPGFSTLAEPSAQELAALEDAIRQLDVRAIFVGTTISPALARRVAADTGTRLVTVYTGSLGEPDGEAGTYLDYMRYNTRQIVDALK